MPRNMSKYRASPCRRLRFTDFSLNPWPSIRLPKKIVTCLVLYSGTFFESKDLLTAKEMSKALGVCETTVHECARSGSLRETLPSGRYTGRGGAQPGVKRPTTHSAFELLYMILYIGGGHTAGFAVLAFVCLQ